VNQLFQFVIKYSPKIVNALITDVRKFNKFENIMRKHHVKDKLASKTYISNNKANRIKQDAQEKAFMKDEDEIKRFLREQRNQWRKESKFKTR
jgi:hypothetical protein